jgi:hypothetical protein
MPRKDGTGPNGKGPKTGRGRGPCKSGPTKPATRRGTGGGRGRGRGSKSS